MSMREMKFKLRGRKKEVLFSWQKTRNFNDKILNGLGDELH